MVMRWSKHISVILSRLSWAEHSETFAKSRSSIKNERAAQNWLGAHLIYAFENEIETVLKK